MTKRTRMLRGAVNQENKPALTVSAMTVAELARCTEVNPDTIRYYARIGLLKPVRDRNNGYKLFTVQDLNRLHFIRKARSLGYHLSEISEIFVEASQGRSPCPRVRDIIRKRIEENRRRLDEMLALQERMEQALSIWQELPDGVPDGHNVCHLIESEN
jgi:MerR family Zn(II)-responsive transcriptional regulator of zntA